MREELFVLKCAVITRELKAVLIQEKVIPARGPLESMADTLVNSYIRQVKFQTLSDADRMSEFYKLFYAVENDIRDLIVEVLQDSVGDGWWSSHVTEEVQKNAERNRDRESAEGLPPRSERVIDYTTFGELGIIIQHNWDVFSGMFSSASKGRVLRVINRLNLIRGPIAHCNFLIEDEALRLKLAIRDWYKLME